MSGYQKPKETTYIGVVSEVLDSVLYEIKVDIPGFSKSIDAFPKRSEIDEPRVGDVVLVTNMDPSYNSYFTYEKLKENDFIGFRSNGKLIDVTKDYITLGIYSENEDYSDATNSKKHRPEPTDWIKLDKDGNLEINIRSKAKIVIKGDANIEVSGKTELKCPDIKVTGGKLEMSGQSSTDMQGPFNCLPTCPFSGAPHSGKIITGT